MYRTYVISSFIRHDEHFPSIPSAIALPRRRHDAVFFVIVTLTGFFICIVKLSYLFVISGLR